MSKPAIKFRLAKTSDLDSIVQLRYNLYAEAGEATVPFRIYKKQCKKFLQENFREKNWKHFVAVYEKQVIANFSLHIIKAIPRPFADKKFIGYLTNAYVKPEFRNKKIGSRIIKNILAYANEIGCESVFVWPSADAKNLYERLEFKQTELCEIRFSN